MTRMHRAQFIPEVLQSSLMDCGPAALQSVLQGFGIRTSYDEIRARCQTDVDGTSIFELAKLAGELGLASSQVLVPRDTLLLPAAACLPAIVVTSEVAGMLHFVVAWNTAGPFVQVMDPGTGRRWQQHARFLASLPDVPIPISVQRFARWRKTRFARDPLRQRLRRVGVEHRRADTLVEAACTAQRWSEYAELDAATRMVTALVDGRAVERGRQATRLLDSVLEHASTDGIPITFWWVCADERPGMLSVRGAPIVCFEPRHPVAGTEPTRSNPDQAVHRGTPRDRSPAQVKPADRTESLAAPFKSVIAKHGSTSLPAFWRMLTADHPFTPYQMLAVVALAAVVSVAEVLLFQELLQALRHFSLPYQRLFGVLVVFSLAVCGLGLEFGLARIVARAGRSLELRVRGALFEKLPRLTDDYVRTRSTSDMAQRCHALHLLHDVPGTLRRALDAVALLASSIAGIAWLFPRGASFALAAAVATVLVPFILSRSASERSQRARAHMVALGRFYLDSLLGALPIRVHGAEQAVRREHEALLSEWARATTAQHRETTLMQAAQAVLATVLGIGLVIAYVSGPAPHSGLLLLVYWASRIPAAGASLVESMVTYRELKHVAARLFAPLGVVEAVGSEPMALPATACTPVESGEAALVPTTPGVSIAMSAVGVKVANRALLAGIDLRLEPSEHVAIVGPSGAGKSSLVSLLLGWLRPTEGEVCIDGRPLDGSRLSELRSQTAWVDPAVQLWNDSLLANLVYGAGSAGIDRGFSRAIETACLSDVLEQLPDGLQSALGEAGVRVSGGQGQRVRIARALLRSNARLVILDEPFRGLERSMRVELLQRIREHFQHATLLFISHDVRDTQVFDRVLVVEGGKVVEDGTPARLIEAPDSRYRALVRADETQDAYSDASWSHAHMEAGKLAQQS